MSESDGEYYCDINFIQVKKINQYIPFSSCLKRTYITWQTC